jgi:hypothetical protein
MSTRCIYPGLTRGNRSIPLSTAETGVSGHRGCLPDGDPRQQTGKIWHLSTGIRIIFRKFCNPDNGRRVSFPKGLSPFYWYPGRFPKGWLPFYQYPIGKPFRFATRLPVDGSFFQKVCYPDNGSSVSFRKLCHPANGIRVSFRKVWSLSHGSQRVELTRAYKDRTERSTCSQYLSGVRRRMRSITELSGITRAYGPKRNRSDRMPLMNAVKGT